MTDLQQVRDEVYEGVAICTPTTGAPSWAFTLSLLGLKYPARVFRLKECPARGLDYGRNELIEWFLHSKCLRMLFLDDDAILHPDTLERLLSWDVPVVSALSVQPNPPHAPVLYRDHIGENDGRLLAWTDPLWLSSIREWIIDHPGLLTPCGAPIVLNPRPGDALAEVTSGSAHCMLVDRDVLESLSLYTGFEPRTSFYRKATDAGFKCFIDRSVVVGHKGSAVAGLLDFAVYDKITHYGM